MDVKFCLDITVPDEDNCLIYYLGYCQRFLRRILLGEGDSICGHSSVGRVQASQAWCRGFDPRCPLQGFFG